MNMFMPFLEPSYGSSSGFVAVLNILRPSVVPRSMKAAVCCSAGVSENTGAFADAASGTMAAAAAAAMIL